MNHDIKNFIRLSERRLKLYRKHQETGLKTKNARGQVVELFSHELKKLIPAIEKEIITYKKRNDGYVH